ncbi:MAG: glycosyltransferase [Crocinitomicaceae bacterium]|nr:glycosyltransferase [Crocinitomicaceae bacterium]
MSSIKIAHLTSAHQDGDVRIFHKECVSLAKAGYDVSMIIPNTASRVEKGVNIISFQIKKGSRMFRAIKAVNRVYKEALKLNAHVYHLHDPELLRIALKLKRKGKIVIYDAHEDLPRQVLSKSYIPKIFRSLISFFLRNMKTQEQKN